MPEPRRRYVALAEAAEYLGVDIRTVRRAIAAGRIEAFRVGTRMIRVDLDQVEQGLLTKIPAGDGSR